MDWNKINLKNIVSYLGTGLMILSLIFIGQRLASYGMDFSLLNSPWIVAGFIGITFFEGGIIWVAAFNFRAIVYNVTGIQAERTLAVKVYGASNLYKYIPGGIMYVLGRNRLAVETAGISHGKVAFSTLLEGVGFVIAAISLALVLSFEYTMTYIRQSELISSSEITGIIGIAAGGILLIIVCIIFLLRRKIADWLRPTLANMEGINAAAIFKRIAVSMLLMIMWGTSFLATIILLGQPVTPTLAATIVGLYLLAWVSGYLTPGAPSGFGIREAIMLMFMTGVIDIGILSAAMIMHRILAVIGDVLAYIAALVYARRHFIRKA